MKITAVSYERLDLQLAEPYTIAYETVGQATNFVLKLETETLVTGLGLAAPDRKITSETPAQVEEALNSVILPFLKGKNAFTYALLLAELKELLGPKSSALAMADIALHDLISKKADVPLYQFLGGYRNNIPTSMTIGIHSIEETLRKAREFIRRGFYILKIKGGKDVAEDIEKMLKLREAYPDCIFRFDGNQGYSVEEAFRFFKATKSVDIEIFEQPVHAGEEEHLGLVTRDTEVPVMADESLKTLRDVFRLAQKERIDLVNIKLMKVGGILEAMHINSVAKSASLEAMVGCLDECSLGIAAGLHFALARPNVRYADLDGHFDMLNDPFEGLFTLRKGVLYPSHASGLGEIQ